MSDFTDHVGAFDVAGRRACPCAECQVLRADADDADRELNKRVDGTDRDARPAKPCCTRIGPGQWCVRDTGHDGACGSESPAADYVRPTFLPRSKS